VVDGRSEDATRSIVQEFVLKDPRVRLVDNPARIQSTGINLAARVANPEANVLIRLDAHAAYPDDYISGLLETLAKTGAESVVVRLRSVGEGCFQRAVAAVSNTIYGTGGAVHRVGGKCGYVDHGHHAAFLRSAFEQVGGYDESFVAAEDAEFDLRLARVGAQIWFTSELVVDYFPRNSLSALAAQYYRNGVGRAQVELKHPGRLRLRQIIPPAFLLLLLLCLALSPLQPWFLLGPIGYVAGCLLIAFALAIQKRDMCLMATFLALPAIHMPWAAGFMRSLIFGAPARRVRASVDPAAA